MPAAAALKRRSLIGVAAENEPRSALPAIVSAKVGTSTVVASAVPPGLAALASIVMPVTALGSEAYLKLPSRTANVVSKAGSRSPASTPLAHASSVSCPEAVKFSKSRV